MTAVRVSTNQEFADLVGIDFTMASRIRNGHRVPSREVMIRIIEAFGLEGRAKGAAMAAWLEGGKTFSKWVQANLYTPA